MNYKKPDSYMTLTPKCGSNGCKHFKAEKAKLLEERNDKRRLRGKAVKE